MIRRSNRRAFLSSLIGAGICRADIAPVVPSEVRRYSDAATEFPVFRLTDPGHHSWLPAPYSRAVSRRNTFLVYTSDRSGSVQAYRMDLKTGESRVLTDAVDLAPDSLTLTPDERNIGYIAGRSLFLGNMQSSHTREVYEAAAGFEFALGFSLSIDGLYGVLVERNSGMDRVRLLTLRTGSAATLSESEDPLADPMPRPGRSSVLYRRAQNELWMVNFDRGQNRRIAIAAGGLESALWSSDGRTVIYLNVPEDPKQLRSLREFTPDTNEDRLIAATSQFVTFNRNGDSSVMVGASGSKASPYVLLLVRSVKRELTLCEHRAGDPRKVTTMFSPNSQRVFFQSDRDGKMAIYAMSVDRLVAETETEGDQ